MSYSKVVSITSHTLYIAEISGKWCLESALSYATKYTQFFIRRGLMERKKINYARLVPLKMTFFWAQLNEKLSYTRD